MTAHSRFGGSSASRWMACPGSVALCESVPAKPSSPYALEGSVAHALAAICLERDLHPTHFLGAPVEHPDGVPPPGWDQILVTQEMCDAVVVYLNEVSHEIAKSKSAVYFVEKGFVLDVETAEPGEVFGTNDCLVYHPETGRLRVFDYKHGAGVSVSADDNAQLKFYAAGAVFANPDWKTKEVILTIVQPRARDPQKEGETEEEWRKRVIVKDWPFSVVDLLEFMGDMKDGVGKAKSWGPFGSGLLLDDGRNAYLDGAFKIGSWCRWCDAAAICPAREAEVLEAAQLSFGDITKLTTDDLPIVSDMGVERAGAVLKALDILDDWRATIREYVEGLLMSGTEVPGWKVVEKIGRAKWVAAEADVAGYVDMIFGVEVDAIMPRRLTTIGDAEKLLKAAGASNADIDSFKLKFTIKESSGLTMAPSSDRRPAIDAVKQAFEGVRA